MTVVDRVTNIEERHQEVIRLEQKAERINERRNEAEAKNVAFQSLQSKIENVQREYRTTCKWRLLAESMEVAYNADAIERLKNNMEADLRTISDTEFDGFDGDQEIRNLEENFSDYSTELNARQNDIQKRVETRCDELLNKLATRRTVLRIPDVGSADDEQVIDEFQRFLKQHKGGTLHQNPAARYEELAEQHDDIEISFDAVQEEYDIGDEAMVELKKLLHNEEVTLAEIDEDVLNDLKNLTEFSQLLIIQFTEDK